MPNCRDGVLYKRQNKSLQMGTTLVSPVLKGCLAFSPNCFSVALLACVPLIPMCRQQVHKEMFRTIYYMFQRCEIWETSDAFKIVWGKWFLVVSLPCFVGFKIDLMTEGRPPPHTHCIPESLGGVLQIGSMWLGRHVELKHI